MIQTTHRQYWLIFLRGSSKLRCSSTSKLQAVVLFQKVQACSRIECSHVKTPCSSHGDDCELRSGDAYVPPNSDQNICGTQHSAAGQKAHCPAGRKRVGHLAVLRAPARSSGWPCHSHVCSHNRGPLSLLRLSCHTASYNKEAMLSITGLGKRQQMPGGADCSGVVTTMHRKRPHLLAALKPASMNFSKTALVSAGDGSEAALLRFRRMCRCICRAHAGAQVQPAMSATKTLVHAVQYAGSCRSLAFTFACKTQSHCDCNQDQFFGMSTGSIKLSADPENIARQTAPSTSTSDLQRWSNEPCASLMQKCCMRF